MVEPNGSHDNVIRRRKDAICYGITKARIQTHTQNTEYSLLLITVGLIKYFVARKQCKGNPWLNLYGNTEHTYFLQLRLHQQQ